MRNPFRYFNSSPEVIRLTVMMYIRYPLSLRQVEDLLFERGIDICHETIRFWWNRFGPMFAKEIRKRRIQNSIVFTLALALGRGVRQDQWRDALPLACGRSRRRGPRSFCHKTPGSHGCVEVFEACDETLWPAQGNRDGPASILRRRAKVHWDCGASGVRSLAQQPGRKFSPTIPTTRTSDGEIQGIENSPKVRRCPCLDPQSFQPRPSPQQPRHLQTKSFCHPSRVASAGGLKTSD